MLEFKRLCPEDIDEMSKIKINAFSEDLRTYGFGPPGYDDLDKMRLALTKYTIYNMVLDSRIVGGMSCCEQARGEFYLAGIYIDEAHQNLGIGAAAMRFLEQEFQEAQVWRLEPPYKSYRNQHFYKKLGYIKVAKRNRTRHLADFIFLFMKRESLMQGITSSRFSTAR